MDALHLSIVVFPDSDEHRKAFSRLRCWQARSRIAGCNTDLRMHFYIC